MKKLIMIFFFLSTSTTAQADLNFKPLKNEWYIASNIAMLGDYSTTLSIQDNSDRYKEIDKLTRLIIGENPTTGRVQRYFFSRILISTAVQYLAPPKISKRIMQYQAFVHFKATANNYRLGLKFSY